MMTARPSHDILAALSSSSGPQTFDDSRGQQQSLPRRKKPEIYLIMKNKAQDGQAKQRDIPAHCADWGQGVK